MKRKVHTEGEMVKSVQELEEENRKFKQMYAELALNNKILPHVDIGRAVTGKGTAAFNVAGEG